HGAQPRHRDCGNPSRQCGTQEKRKVAARDPSARPTCEDGGASRNRGTGGNLPEGPRTKEGKSLCGCREDGCRIERMFIKQSWPRDQRICCWPSGCWEGRSGHSGDAQSPRCGETPVVEVLVVSWLQGGRCSEWQRRPGSAPASAACTARQSPRTP